MNCTICGTDLSFWASYYVLKGGRYCESCRKEYLNPNIAFHREKVEPIKSAHEQFLSSIRGMYITQNQFLEIVTNLIPRVR